MRYLGTLLVIGLVVYAAIGIVRSEPAERLNVPRPLWLLVVVLFPVIGAVVWIVVSTTHRASKPRTIAHGPSAPDDDEEFLWRLDEERRRTNPPNDNPTP
ncbi:MAG: PLD nuclease N-terminal domain-containing protein [Brevundimonas sp.]